MTDRTQITDALTLHARTHAAAMQRQEAEAALASAQATSKAKVDRAVKLLMTVLDTGEQSVRDLIAAPAPDLMACGVVVGGYLIEIRLDVEGDDWVNATGFHPQRRPAGFDTVSQRLNTFEVWAQFVFANRPIAVDRYMHLRNDYTTKFCTRDEYAALRVTRGGEQWRVLPGYFLQDDAPAQDT